MQSKKLSIGTLVALLATILFATGAFGMHKKDALVKSTQKSPEASAQIPVATTTPNKPATQTEASATATPYQPEA